MTLHLSTPGCTGRISSKPSGRLGGKPVDQIAAAIELARMGGMSGLPDLETQMARYSMRILAETLDVDPDAPVLSEQHVVAVGYLIEGHAVSCGHKASVKGVEKNGGDKVVQYAREYPSLGAEFHRTRRRLDKDLFCDFDLV